MRTVGVVTVVLATLLLAALSATGADKARPFVLGASADVRTPRGQVWWHDDQESGAPGWMHGDDSAQDVKFHVDTYLAYQDSVQDPDYSWWCGELNPAFAGGSGYGNLWNQWLELPPIEVGDVSATATTWGSIKAMYRESPPPARSDPPQRSAAPVLTFRYRYDCELGYDYVWVEAESLGEWVALNPGGWDGKSGGWQNLAAEGFSLAGFDDPLRIRFRFESDGGYSDADGIYVSDGGAFHVDGISVYDAVTGAVLFWEDCEGSVGQCVPGIPEPSGDHWRLVDSACQAYSGTRVWSPSWPDSASVPPNLRNWLRTPDVEIPFNPGMPCTLFFVGQFFMSSSGEYGGSWKEIAVADGEEMVTGWWWGHQCTYDYGPCDHYLGSIPIIGPGAFSSATHVAGKWLMITDAAGEGCDIANCPLGYCSAGITIDDTWVEIRDYAGRPGTWSRLRALCR